jgi:hypothetical protein
VDRNTLLWSITLFFGASVVFAAIQRATKDDGFGITLLLEVGALALMVAGIVAFVKLKQRSDRDRDR